MSTLGDVYKKVVYFMSVNNNQGKIGSSLITKPVNLN